MPGKFHELITPGRKRLLERSNNNDVDWDFNQDIFDQENFQKGVKVFHKKYGYGKIISIEGDRAEVNFFKTSQKKVFLKFLQFMN